MAEWKRDGRHHVRKCPHCRGTGRETLYNDGLCDACPWKESTDVDHPSNTPKNEHGRYDEGIAHKLVRCDKCGGVWVVYFETGDDSWDVPGPEYVGRSIPAEEWRIEDIKQAAT